MTRNRIFLFLFLGKMDTYCFEYLLVRPHLFVLDERSRIMSVLVILLRSIENHVELQSHR